MLMSSGGRLGTVTAFLPGRKIIALIIIYPNHFSVVTFRPQFRINYFWSQSQSIMNQTTRIQLSALMFLEFFIWGSWYVTMGTYLDKVLHATGLQVGAAYSAMAISTIISPFFVGMIADRFFAAQRVLGVLHLAGAASLYYLTTISNPDIF